MPARARRSLSHRDERGAALVEFALIAVPLFALLMGMIEFGWGFYQVNSVRHGANEALRIAAVNSKPSGTGTQGERILKLACTRMNSGGKGATLTMTVGADKSVGTGEVRIVVSKPFDQLTGFYAPILNGKVIREDVRTKLEQTAEYSDATVTCP